jgi:hypothetical protein
LKKLEVHHKIEEKRIAVELDELEELAVRTGKHLSDL